MTSGRLVHSGGREGQVEGGEKRGSRKLGQRWRETLHEWR